MTPNPHLSRSLLRDPSGLPARSADELADFGKTVVFAPHPDDESLACGGLISLLGEAGVPVEIVFVSDGSASHLASAKFPRPALAALRRSEAQAAAAILGVSPDRTTFLEIQDSRIPHPHDDGFAPLAGRIAELLAALDPATILTPWRRDVHHDHIATTALVTAALGGMDRPPRVIEYPVWVWEADSHDKAPTSGEMRAWRLDISAVLPRKLRAIAAHASQMTRLIDDDPGGFTMSASQLARFTTGHEIFFEPSAPAEDRTLGTGYFEGMYAEKRDPWEFETSPYERRKYLATLAALPEKSYGRVLELGCSIGVLTEMLAPRAGRLLGIDASALAIASARERCAGLANVELRTGFVPADWPEGAFDLIVISEVAYYLSSADLKIAFDRVAASLAPGGDVLMVHWTPLVASYPQTGDQVHDHALSRAEFRHLHHERAETYRIDAFRRR